MLVDRGPCVITGEGESGQTPQVHGRATEVHKPLLSAAKTLDLCPHRTWNQAIPMWQETGVCNLHE
eukprot:6482416-Amphidinium_carterae.4